MGKDIHEIADEKTIEMIRSVATQFKITLDLSCKMHDIEEGKISTLVDFIEKTYDDKFVKKIDDVKKKSVNRSFRGAVCGLTDEIEATKSFLESVESGILVVIGKEYSGKTTVLNKSLEGKEIYLNYIDEINDFLDKKQYMNVYAFPILYIIDNIDDMKVDKKHKAFLSKMFSEKKMRNKVVITARMLDDALLEKATVVRVEQIPFTLVHDFFKDYKPGLIEDVSYKTLFEAYDNCGRSFYKFYRWLAKKEDIVTTRSVLKVLSDATKQIYTGTDRNAVHAMLSEKLVDDDDKNDAPDTMTYFNQLEGYLVENTFNFFDTSDPAFQHNLDILDYMRKNRFTIETEKVVNLLAHGMKTSTKTGQNVLLPYSYTYIKYKAGKKAEKRH